MQPKYSHWLGNIGFVPQLPHSPKPLFYMSEEDSIQDHYPSVFFLLDKLLMFFFACFSSRPFQKFMWILSSMLIFVVKSHRGTLPLLICCSLISCQGLTVYSNNISLSLSSFCLITALYFDHLGCNSIVNLEKGKKGTWTNIQKLKIMISRRVYGS